MAQVLQFRCRLNVFAPEELTTMADVFEAAMSSLEEDLQSQALIRDLVAKRIMTMARAGDLDAEHLYSSAVKGLRKPLRAGLSACTAELSSGQSAV